MRRTYPHNFALVAMTTLLVLLAGYLWLSDIVPKQGPSPIREMLPSTAKGPATQEDANTWQTYQDQTFGFSLHYPSTWFASVEKEKGYNVNFIDTSGDRRMTIKVLKDAKAEDVIMSLKKRSARGLFPSEGVDSMLLIDGSEATTLMNYTSPRGDINVKSAVIEKNGLVIVLEEQRHTTIQADANYFDRWVRSLSM